MDDQAARVARTLEEVLRTADRLARRMGAEFVPDPKATRSFQQAGTSEPGEQLPLRSS